MSDTRVVGVSIPTVLLIIFIVLKATGNIGWNWMWVLSPLWIPLAIGFVMFPLVAVFMLSVGFIKLAKRRNSGLKKE